MHRALKVRKKTKFQFFLQCCRKRRWIAVDRVQRHVIFFFNDRRHFQKKNTTFSSFYLFFFSRLLPPVFQVVFSEKTSGNVLLKEIRQAQRWWWCYVYACTNTQQQTTNARTRQFIEPELIEPTSNGRISKFPKSLNSLLRLSGVMHTQFRICIVLLFYLLASNAR